jgi:hypothetical protein
MPEDGILQVFHSMLNVSTVHGSANLQTAFSAQETGANIP